MGLLGDFKEYKESFSKSPTLVKAIIIIAFFMSISSFTSLADQIFQWRGFILDGVQFYRNYVTDPVRNLLSSISIHYTSTAIDLLIIMGLFTSACIRAAIVIKRIPSYTIHLPDIITLVGNIVSFLAAFYFFEGLDITGFLFQYGFFYSFLLIMVSLVLSLSGGWKNHNKERIRLVISMWLPIVVSIGFVLILAAINEGLTRPLNP